MSERTVASAVAEALYRHGIREIFGQSLPSALMLAAEKIGIRQVFFRTENGAGTMADGFARITNTMTAVGAQNGAGATLLVPPMAEALKVSTPMLALVQEVPESDRDRNAFQEFDHFALFAGVSKWTRRIDSAERAIDYVDMAFAEATSGRPGPVVLLLPKDVLNLPAAEPRVPRAQSLGAFPRDRTRPNRESVLAAAEILATAKNPVILAGGGIHLSGASAALTRLQEVASLPVTTTVMGKGSVAETGALSLGVSAHILGENGVAHFQSQLIETADVVLIVGSRTNENATDGWTLIPDDATVIHLDVDPSEIGRSYEAVRVVGDAREALTDLADALEESDLSVRTAARAGLIERIAAAKTAHLERTRELRESDQSPLRPERVAADLESLLEPSDIVAADASYSTVWVANYLTAQKAGQRFLTPRGLAGLGWGYPLALGAQVARPDSRVICIVGDGGFAHMWSELETAVRESLPVVLIVLNNSILGSQQHIETVLFGETTTAIEFAPVDHAMVARAVGMDSVRIDSAADFRPALEAALDARRPYLIDVLTDPRAFAPLRRLDGLEEMLVQSALV